MKEFYGYMKVICLHMRGERVSIVLLEMIFVGWLTVADAGGGDGDGATSAKNAAAADADRSHNRPSLFSS